MTRINCVPVEILSNAHLVAEYKEITRPLGKAVARLEKGEPPTIPDTYRLGKGHETFFMNKALYLLARRLMLFNEMLSRGMSPDKDKFTTIQKDYREKLCGTQYWNHWEPTPEAIYLNMARLAKRSGMEEVIDELAS